MNATQSFGVSLLATAVIILLGIGLWLVFSDSNENSTAPSQVNAPLATTTSSPSPADASLQPSMPATEPPSTLARKATDFVNRQADYEVSASPFIVQVGEEYLIAVAATCPHIDHCVERHSSSPITELPVGDCDQRKPSKARRGNHQYGQGKCRVLEAAERPNNLNRTCASRKDENPDHAHLCFSARCPSRWLANYRDTGDWWQISHLYLLLCINLHRRVVLPCVPRSWCRNGLYNLVA